jgi:hypothetical protein
MLIYNLTHEELVQFLQEHGKRNTVQIRFGNGFINKKYNRLMK